MLLFSAGIGRTGTYIALDYLLQEAENQGMVNVHECVIKLRRSRVNMIQTAVSVYVISTHIFKSPLIVAPEDLNDCIRMSLTISAVQCQPDALTSLFHNPGHGTNNNVNKI